MKAMSQAQEFTRAAPPGRRIGTVVRAEAKFSKAGASMLEIEVRDDSSGQTANDYIITDGTAKGAGMGKKKLRGLDTPLIQRSFDTDEDIPDAAIAQELVGLQLYIDWGNEPRFGKNETTGEYDKPLFDTDEKTGQQVQAQKLIVKGYSRSNPSAGAPVHAAAPAQVPTAFVPQQGFAPQQAQAFVPQQAQAFAPPQAPIAQPQYAGATVTPQYAQAPAGYVPQQAPMAQPQAQYAQPQTQPLQAPAGFPGAPAGNGQVATPPWNGGAPVQAPAETAGKKPRKMKVEETPGE